MHKTKIVLVQLGSPASPKVSEVRAYLAEFLGDPRVVDLPAWWWKLILWFFILPTRPRQSAKAYGRIYQNGAFPLVAYTEILAQKIQRFLAPEEIEVEHAFILGRPRLSQILDNWEKENPQTRAQRFVIVPLFPQYSESTTASVYDQWVQALKGRTVIPQFEFVTSFHRSQAFIEQSAALIEETVQDPEALLVLSFHGLPIRRSLYKGDPYYQQCFETYLLLKEALKKRQPKRWNEHNIVLSFQSRFGSEEWLRPATDELVLELVSKGHQKIAIYAPSFVADCLETIDELGHELGNQVKKMGGELIPVPCLNGREIWARDFAQFLKAHVRGSQTYSQLVYEHTFLESQMSLPKQEMKSPPIDPAAKKILKIVFLTLFLDLVGFSIIFPMFPALAKYYLEVDGQNTFLQLIFGSITSLLSFGGPTGSFTPVVLFGGVLGALYSFLQFLAAPFWGSLSDRIGRRPVLLISVLGLALSYLLWGFAGSFTILILGRFIGGIMGGNISAATAVVADVTSEETRSKGMAVIGIAFALGFILGPAIGGALTLVDLSRLFPGLVSWGLNPFSAPAFLAMALSFFNLFYIVRKLPETLPPERRGHKKETERSINPFYLFRPLPFKGANLTNFGHFLFLLAFSGMEFTLTFLVVERLGWSSLQNGYMFIFIGLILVLVQGGVVRRKAHQVGEKKMALMGLVSLVPGLLLIGSTKSGGQTYAGLFFLAVGSAMVIPCLTSLASLYTPREHQGKALGIFRSLGALGRVLGPLLASLLYWKLGSSSPYFIGAVFLIIPLVLVAMLPPVTKNQTTS